MYKEASRQAIRFATSKGNLTVEQLWDLSITELDNLAVALETEYKESGKKSFVIKKSAKDKTAKLRFDIVLDILTTKVEEADVAANERANKAKDQEILELIAKKQKSSLEDLSIEQLEKMLSK